MNPQWHLLQEGKTYGPHTGEQLVEFARCGRISPGSMLWTAGMADWVRAEAIEGLFPSGTAPQPVVADTASITGGGWPPGQAPPSATSPPPSAGHHASLPGGHYASGLRPATSGLAIASLVLGILGLFTLGLTGVLGLIFGILSLSSIKASPRLIGGRGLARAGLAVSLFSVLMGTCVIFFGLATTRGIATTACNTQVQNDMASLGNALCMYKLNGGSYPTTQQGLKALVDKPATAPVPRMWTRISNKVPLDPWGSEYLYRLPGRKKATEFEIISKGKDGQEGTGDDISSQDP